MAKSLSVSVAVLQFVGSSDDPRSCRFSQMMEQRLEKVFSEAQAKVLNVNSRLSVQVLSLNDLAACTLTSTPAFSSQFSFDAVDSRSGVIALKLNFLIVLSLGDLRDPNERMRVILLNIFTVW